MDSERGMEADEEYYLTDAEIRDRLTRAGFGGIAKKYFLTQWALNHLFVAKKPAMSTDLAGDSRTTSRHCAA
jgi:hypothetical protein